MTGLDKQSQMLIGWVCQTDQSFSLLYEECFLCVQCVFRTHDFLCRYVVIFYNTCPTFCAQNRNQSLQTRSKNTKIYTIKPHI